MRSKGSVQRARFELIDQPTTGHMNFLVYLRGSRQIAKSIVFSQARPATGFTRCSQSSESPSVIGHLVACWRAQAT